MTFSTTSETSSPLMLLPSTATSTSSVLIPAFSAGEPSIGAATTTSPFFFLELDPDPHVRPREALVVLLALLWGQEARVPVVPSVSSIPSMAP